MRGSAKRKDKYEAKLTGRTIPGQAAHFGLAVGAQVEAEEHVKSLGVPAIYQNYYMIFAKEIKSILSKHKGDIAPTEACIAWQRWLSRGLDGDTMNKIVEHYGLPRCLTCEERLTKEDCEAAGCYWWGDACHDVPAPPQRYEHYIIGDDHTVDFDWPVWWDGQTFTVGTVGLNEAHVITSVKLKLFRTGSPGIFNVRLMATDGEGKPTGPDLSSGSIDGNSLTPTSPGQWYEISMSPYTLQPSTKYAIVANSPNCDTNNMVHWRMRYPGGGYAGGSRVWSDSNREFWEFMLPADVMFEIWGTPV